MEEKNTQNNQHAETSDASMNPPTEASTAPEQSTDATVPMAGDMGTEATTAAATPEAVEAKAMPWTFIIAVLVVIGLLAGGIWWLSQSGSSPQELGSGNTATPTTATFSADEYPDVVAVVNGTAVSSERFVQGMEQAAQQAAQQGANPEDEAVRGQIESQTATALVNTELLIQAANEADVSADAAAIDAEIDGIVQQFGSEEEFQTQLETAGITLDELRADFAEQLTIDAFIRQTPEWGNVSIEEGEAQAFYDDIASQNAGQELPEFAEVEAAIEEQLLGTKQQEVTQEIIDRLRAEAEIEVLI